ncbi:MULTISPECIES: iron chelate uptake ABC transporter family permease subunit [Streptomyces]|jgi:iron complex transport system permease protein|uniref:Iron chelate uptake ABC transporter family permease subunit n=1 Tax=Streptomyces doudnae TaxID=3075536 RepID=A0ABD5ETQ7_9ACTN|nr:MULTISPECIES: iron chelate uptake ABC transporter family permease subunit [unclassified Streptomyces]MDT0436792.1 iron chelate uptake ABC transporter family permease subunit [Streptomyces sp. DSM 41981]MYQ62465.1 iron chelate uptake ABC transporter family permease subunit [Streptomyces sp. SID4950]SCD38092.1 iron complex transport system permease protein [Streptomyces sp. SolWspMP-5a-2]
MTSGTGVPARTRVVRSPSRRLSVRIDVRTLTVCLTVLAATVGVGVLALGTGEFTISPADVVRTLLGNGSARTDFVVNELRLPRLLTGILVGAALGLSGALFQSLSRNPLGSPDIVGFTYGSATGGLLVVLVLGGTSGQIAFGAVAGGLATAFLVYLLAWRHGVHGYRLVLVGIGVSALLQGVNAYLLARARFTQAAQAMVWLNGSLNGRDWGDVRPAAVGLLVVLPLVAPVASRLRVLEMGDDVAGGLGVSVQRTRLVILVLATAACAVATAAAGPVPFVALIAPQLARRLTRAPGPNLAAATCAGALLVVTADFASQRVHETAQLPVGVVTAVVGGVYLGVLLRRQRKAGRV